MVYIHPSDKSSARARHPPWQAGDESAGGGTRVDEELVHVLEGVEAVGAAPAEHVDVEAVGLGEQQVGLARDEGEALEEADAQGAVGDDLAQRQRRGLDVEAALDDLEVGRHGAQVLVRLLVVRLPRQSVWPIFPGARSFLNFAGMSSALSGMCRSR